MRKRGWGFGDACCVGWSGKWKCKARKERKVGRSGGVAWSRDGRLSLGLSLGEVKKVPSREAKHGTGECMSHEDSIRSSSFDCEALACSFGLNPWTGGSVRFPDMIATSVPKGKSERKNKKREGETKD